MAIKPQSFNSYFGNRLSTAKGEVVLQSQLSVVTGSTPTVTILAGHGGFNDSSAASKTPAGVPSFAFSSADSGTGNVVTVTFPSNYGRCVGLRTTVVNSTDTDATQAVITTNYTRSASTPTLTGTMAFKLVQPLANTSTGVISWKGAASGTWIVYLEANFELGS